MSAPGGRPREYENHAERQAAYRERKAREAADMVDALARLRHVLRSARRTGKVIPFDASTIDTEHESSVMLNGMAQQIAWCIRKSKRP